MGPEVSDSEGQSVVLINVSDVSSQSYIKAVNLQAVALAKDRNYLHRQTALSMLNGLSEAVGAEQTVSDILPIIKQVNRLI